MKRTSLVLVLLLSAPLAACAGRRGPCCRASYPPRPGGPASPGATAAAAAKASGTSAEKMPEKAMTKEKSDAQPTRRLYRGTDGKVADLEEAVGEWGEVDLIAFGEMHGHLTGAEAQLRVLKTLAAQPRPLALAMEFFERDTQPALDAYLAGSMDKATFVKETKRNRAYAATHGPLIDFCKENGIPVIAANAPRRLVTAYRKSGQDYETWRGALSAQEQAWLPEETQTLDDAYKVKFMNFMGPKRGPQMFRAQSLWDDAMADAMVSFRAQHPNHRILLIVGGFHVERGLGTVTKYRMRRGKDEVRIFQMEFGNDAALSFLEEDVGRGDLILKVPRPKPRAHPSLKGPNPHKKLPQKGAGAS